MRNKQHFFSLIIFLFSMVISAQTDSNKLDDKGKKHGVWKGAYAESKRPRYEGTFEHGKEVGTFKFFDDTKAKTVIATREFNAKDGSAYTIFYNQSGHKVSEGREVNHLYEGEWKYYHENLPDIMTLENYKAGKLNGKRTVYYRGSGVKGEENIAEEANYSNGLKNGSYKKYTMKGVQLEDSNYKNDALDGPAVYKDPLGNLVSKGIFKNGQKTGVWEFYENGKLVKKDNINKIKRKKPTKPKEEPGN
jgi:antitoxin component YwqK of YwqJK toxin-antitoxin module